MRASWLHTRAATSPKDMALRGFRSLSEVQPIMTPTALVLIDVQKGVFDGRGGANQAIADARMEALCSRLARLAIGVLDQGSPVILVRHDGPVGHTLEAGSPGWNFHPALPDAGAIVVAKRVCDAFHETELDWVLADFGVQRIVVGGFMTEYCIDTTCRRAISLGYDVTLLADGHGTVDGLLPAEAIRMHHNAVLGDLSAGWARITLQTIAEFAPNVVAESETGSSVVSNKEKAGA